jgi:site-specific DNA-methyltransferase (cytosine-N4-specific)
VSETFLSRLHPYPAMVADELARELADRYVGPTDSVLDPCCGSGRLLAAASHTTGARVGYDVNPLACLLTECKLRPMKLEVVESVMNALSARRARARAVRPIRLRGRRTAEWFSYDALSELAELIEFINSLQIAEPELLLVAAAFSATARDVSWIGRSGWKLHRMSELDRRALRPSVWERMKARLGYCVARLGDNTAQTAPWLVERRDARRSLRVRPKRLQQGFPFDVVLTSPPYGDSMSTVQYGGASELLLDLVSRLRGCEEFYSLGSEIDNTCLGSCVRRKATAKQIHLPRSYWAGARDTESFLRVAIFLHDYSALCAAVANAVKPGGTVVMVVGRRRVGSFRVKLDQFTIDRLSESGMELTRRDVRALRGKRLPRRVNRYGRSSDSWARSTGAVMTMGSEVILVFRKRVAEDSRAETGRGKA